VRKQPGLRGVVEVLKSRVSVSGDPPVIAYRHYHRPTICVGTFLSCGCDLTSQPSGRWAVFETVSANWVSGSQYPHSALEPGLAPLIIAGRHEPQRCRPPTVGRRAYHPHVCWSSRWSAETYSRSARNDRDTVKSLSPLACTSCHPSHPALRRTLSPHSPNATLRGLRERVVGESQINQPTVNEQKDLCLYHACAHTPSEGGVTYLPHGTAPSRRIGMVVLVLKQEATRLWYRQMPCGCLPQTLSPLFLPG
jgi:hypothetical protein